MQSLPYQTHSKISHWLLSAPNLGTHFCSEDTFQHHTLPNMKAWMCWGKNFSDKLEHVGEDAIHNSHWYEWDRTMQEWTVLMSEPGCSKLTHFQVINKLLIVWKTKVSWSPCLQQVSEFLNFEGSECHTHHVARLPDDVPAHHAILCQVKLSACPDHCANTAHQ